MFYDLRLVSIEFAQSQTSGKIERMAYARKAPRRRGRPAAKGSRGTRMSGGGYTTRRSFKRTPARRRAPMRRSKGNAFTTYALAHCDPFDDRCKGVKVPDTNTMPSVALTTIQETSISTTGVNANCHMFYPNPASQEVFCTNKNKSSTSWDWGPSDTATSLVPAQQVQNIKLGAIAAGYDLIRPVAHGCRISCALSPNTVTGFVHIAVGAPASFLQLTLNGWLPDSIARLSEMPWYQRVTLASLCVKPITIVNKILDTTSQTYYSPARAFKEETAIETGSIIVGQAVASVNVAGHGNYDRDSLNGFAMVFIAVEGAPASSVACVVEHISHYEAIPKSIGLQTGGAAAPSQPHVLAGVSHAAAQMSATHREGEEQTYIGAFAQRAQEGFDRSTGEFSNFVMGQAENFGYAVGRHAIGRVGNMLFGSNSNQLRLT